jgi:hypothetical protein
MTSHCVPYSYVCVGTQSEVYVNLREQWACAYNTHSTTLNTHTHTHTHIDIIYMLIKLTVLFRFNPRNSWRSITIMPTNPWNTRLMNTTCFGSLVLTLREIKPASFISTRIHLDETVHSKNYFSILTTQYFITTTTTTAITTAFTLLHLGHVRCTNLAWSFKYLLCYNINVHWHDLCDTRIPNCNIPSSTTPLLTGTTEHFIRQLRTDHWKPKPLV